MRFCFKLGCVGFIGPVALLAAASETTVATLASVVRADRRTGRLVRTVTVAPRVGTVKGIKAREPVSEPVAKVVGAAVSGYVERTAERYQVDPLLVQSVIEVESNYNPLAVSPKGARGLMQLMPGTARRLSVKNSFDALENIDGGVRHLKYLLTLFGDRDPRLALAAYNAGEAAVMKHRGIPPYPETAQYVYRVGKKYGEARRAAEARARPQPQLPEHPPIEQYVDAEGRLHFRTRSVS